MKQIEVEMIKHPTDEDWLFCKQCTLNTVGMKSTKMPTEEWNRWKNYIEDCYNRHIPILLPSSIDILNTEEGEEVDFEEE